jgi:hypothetical protein
MTYSKALTEVIAVSDQAWEAAKKHYEWFVEVAANGVSRDEDSHQIAKMACFLVLGELEKNAAIEKEECAKLTGSAFSE